LVEFVEKDGDEGSLAQSWVVFRILMDRKGTLGEEASTDAKRKKKKASSKRDGSDQPKSFASSPFFWGFFQI
jgi:hypothetical protein